MPPVIFCPDCNTFLDSQAAVCPAFGMERRLSERLPEPGDPDTGFFFTLFCFLALVAGQFLFIIFNLTTVAVMGLVVDYHDVLFIAQFPPNSPRVRYRSQNAGDVLEVALL